MVVLGSLLAMLHHLGPPAEAASGTAAPGITPAVGKELAGPSASAGQPGEGSQQSSSPVLPRAVLASPPLPSAAPSPSAPSPSPADSPTPSVPGGGQPPDADLTPTPSPELTAVIQTSTRLLEVMVSVTVSNPGPGDAADWEVVVTVPSGQSVREVSGAAHHRAGTQVSFTPLPDRGALAAGEELTFQFRLPGLFASPPSGCTIDGRPCG